MRYNELVNLGRTYANTAHVRDTKGSETDKVSSDISLRDAPQGSYPEALHVIIAVSMLRMKRRAIHGASRKHEARHLVLMIAV